MHSARSLRIAVVFVALAVLGVAFVAPAQRARADANAPRWTGGDFWLYADSGNPNNTLRVEVVGRENAVTLLGATYDTFHLRETATTGSLSLTADTWVREGDLGIVRSSITIFNVLTITTYDPPRTQASFPLTPLKSWSVTLNVTVKVGNGNPFSVGTSVSYQVDAELDVAVPAGTFHSFSIRTLGGGAYTKLFYSEQAGYWSKRETYDAQGQKTGEMVLTGHRYQWNTTFLVIIAALALLIALVIGAFLWKKRKQAMGLPGGPAGPRAPPMPPRPPTPP